MTKKNPKTKTIDDDQDEDSMEVLQELENIDDECDQHGIAFVKIGLYNDKQFCCQISCYVIMMKIFPFSITR